MSNDRPEIPAVPGVPTTRRGMLTSALLILAMDRLVARFALARAVSNLSLPQLEELYDEVFETVEGRSIDRKLRIITERDDES